MQSWIKPTSVVGSSLEPVRKHKTGQDCIWKVKLCCTLLHTCSFYGHECLSMHMEGVHARVHKCKEMCLKVVWAFSRTLCSKLRSINLFYWQDSESQGLCNNLRCIVLPLLLPFTCLGWKLKVDGDIPLQEPGVPFILSLSAYPSRAFLLTPLLLFRFRSSRGQSFCLSPLLPQTLSADSFWNVLLTGAATLGQVEGEGLFSWSNLETPSLPGPLLK